MLSEVYTDQRYLDYQGPSRSVKHPRVSSVGGGAIAPSQDGSRCIVAGKDVLRILRVTDPPYSRSAIPQAMQIPGIASDAGRLCTGSGGAAIEAGANMWTTSGLKMDSAPTDVVWARGTFDTKIITSARNGEIIYWDINRVGSKYEVKVKEHKRAVNKLATSPFLPYLFASGSQDGYLRIWDLRTPPSSTMKVYHATGVRALAFCPVPSHPLTICTGLESGNIQRWDIRMKVSPLERITLAHSSSILSMDWQLPSMRETGLGWLATSGMDRRVKIWNLTVPASAFSSLPTMEHDAITLQHKMGPEPFRVLYTPFPVRRVKWRVGWDCEVAIVSNNESESETIEIWDIRRGWIGKWALEGAEGGVTDILFPSSHVIWAQHTNGTFAQHDLRHSVRPLDAIPRVAMSWATNGKIAFVADKEEGVEVPFDDVHPQKLALLRELRLRPKATSDPVHIPLQQTLGVQDIPSVDSISFIRLARSYVFDGDRRSVCETNAELASEAGQYRAAQIWLLLLSQLKGPRGASPPPSVYSLSQTNIARSQTSPAVAATKIKSPADSLTRRMAIDTRPIHQSPSLLHRTRTEQSKHGQDTTPSSRSSSPHLSVSPRPMSLALPPLASTSRLAEDNLPEATPRHSSAWLDNTLTPPYDPLSPARTGAGSRRASTVLPISPRTPRPALRRASMSTPGVAAGGPVRDAQGHVRAHDTHRHAHVGEGALDDSDSSSDSDASGSVSSQAGPATIGEKSVSNASPVTRLARASRALPSPLSQLLSSREDSPDGNLAGDERSLDSDVSHSPPSTSSPSSSGSESEPSPCKISSEERIERIRLSRTPSAGSGLSKRGANISLSHRALSKQESHSSIRTVTAMSDTPSTLLNSVAKLSSEKEEDTHDGRADLRLSSEGMSTRRPSPLHQRALPIGMGLGLSNMDDAHSVNAAKDAQPKWATNGRLSNSRKAEIEEDEERYSAVVWNALREALDWFAEKGDVQMCALLVIIAPDELGVGPVRAARFVDAYVDMLSRLQLHTTAAHVRKCAPYNSVGDATQVQTTLYTSCGRCGKGIKVKSTGLGLCDGCKSLPTLCSICHLPVRTLLIHCPTCGHGGHHTCYRAFYLARPLSELPVRVQIAGTAFGLVDSYSSVGSGSSVYYSLSDASERDEAADEEGSELDGGGSGSGSGGSGSVGSTRRELANRGREKTKEEGYLRPQMRVLGHACAAGCGHFCWAATGGRAV